MGQRCLRPSSPGPAPNASAVKSAPRFFTLNLHLDLTPHSAVLTPNCAFQIMKMISCTGTLGRLSHNTPNTHPVFRTPVGHNEQPGGTGLSRPSDESKCHPCRRPLGQGWEKGENEGEILIFGGRLHPKGSISPNPTGHQQFNQKRAGLNVVWVPTGEWTLARGP